MAIFLPYRTKEKLAWDSSACFIDLNGMATEAYVVIENDMYYLWLEQEQDREELEKEFGLGYVWDESAADCEKFGVRAYDDLDELNNDLASVCGDERKEFFYWDDLVGICGC